MQKECYPTEIMVDEVPESGLEMISKILKSKTIFHSNKYLGHYETPLRKPSA